MTPGLLLLLLLLFQVKHLLADYVWQSNWMVTNKGRYGHPGGLAHAGLHAALTVPVLMVTPLPFLTVLAIAALEWIVHYHIDWAKARLTNESGLTPEDKSFWAAFGIDQAAHQLTYLGIAWLLI